MTRLNNGSKGKACEDSYVWDTARNPCLDYSDSQNLMCVLWWPLLLPPDWNPCLKSHYWERSIAIPFQILSSHCAPTFSPKKWAKEHYFMSGFMLRLDSCRKAFIINVAIGRLGDRGHADSDSKHEGFPEQKLSSPFHSIACCQIKAHVLQSCLKD